MLRALKTGVTSFASVAAYNSLPSPVATPGRTRVVRNLFVLPGFFDVPGIAAHLGRLPFPEESSAPWAVGSDAFLRDTLHGVNSANLQLAPASSRSTRSRLPLPLLRSSSYLRSQQPSPPGAPPSSPLLSLSDRSRRFCTLNQPQARRSPLAWRPLTQLLACKHGLLYFPVIHARSDIARRSGCRNGPLALSHSRSGSLT